MDLVSSAARSTDATMKDPEFLAEAAKANIEVNPMDGAAVDDLLGEVYASPKDVIAKASRATTN